MSTRPELSKLVSISAMPDPPALLNIEVLSLDQDHVSQTAVDSGVATEQARLFGIYTGQIQARINRIWRRPRTPVNELDDTGGPNADESFRCQAQIVQDAVGNVQEILLLNCNGSLSWQRSLVTAIGQASPLPAPPVASVFRHTITLDFLGLAYVPGSSDDEY
jgi:hypothetical protein